MRSEPVEDGGLTCVATCGRAGKLVPQKHGAIFDGHASITS